MANQLACKLGSNIEMVNGAAVSTQPKAYDYVLYDTDYINATGAQKVRFFSQRNYINGPLAGTQKTNAETNMTGDGQLPTPNAHMALGIQIQLLADVQQAGGGRLTELDMLNLKANAFVSYFEGQRETFSLNFEQLSGPGMSGL
jgi:hypothetical protein